MHEPCVVAVVVAGVLRLFLYRFRMNDVNILFY